MLLFTGKLRKTHKARQRHFGAHCIPDIPKILGQTLLVSYSHQNKESVYINIYPEKTDFLVSLKDYIRK
jgi:hypothetical protein